MKVVFDLGGVLLRWRPDHFLARLLPQRCTTPQATRALVDALFEGFGGDWAEFDRGTLDAAPLAQRIAARIGLPVHDARRVIDAIPDELQPLPDSVELLRRLHERDHELYFLSNMPQPYASHLEATHAFLGLFRAGVFSSRVQLVKPEAAIFAHAQEAFDTRGAPTVFIDDAARNVGAARALGWHAIHFRDARQCERELAALGAV
jgi:putative hydrolase of the HAD superfamily